MSLNFLDNGGAQDWFGAVKYMELKRKVSCVIDS